MSGLETNVVEAGNEVIADAVADEQPNAVEASEEETIAE